MLRFDHVIIAVLDLEEAASRLYDRFGLASVAGGRHAGHGTANRLVPLGHDYLELVTVVDPVEAEASPFGRWVHAHSTPGSTAGLCVRTSDLIGIEHRLGLPAVPMTRARPDGTVLRWRLLGLEPALAQGLPFFIEWDVAPDDHPGRADAGHAVEPTGISWVEAGGEPGGFADWLGPHMLDLRVGDGAPGVHRVAVGTTEGAVVLDAGLVGRRGR